MCEIILAGWSPGLNKVQLNHLLRERASMSLSVAKQAVDDLLAGNEVTIQVSDHQYSDVLQLLKQVGVLCRT